MGAQILQLKKIEITIELVPATPDDLKELDYWKDLGDNVFKKVMKIKVGIPYWVINSKQEIEPFPYRTTLDTDVEMLANYLNENRILIAKNPFK